MKKLTTTSYAILSLLAMRTWSAYELTQQMHRNVGLYWPRAERGIYDEVKNLTEHGLANVSDEAHGRRPRSVYRITPAGRRALRAWLATPVAVPLQVESEVVLRTAFAENGTREDLLASLAALRGQVAEQAELAARITEAYVTGEGPYPERLHVIALVTTYLVGHLAACDAWAAWAAAEVEVWAQAATPSDTIRDLEILREAHTRAAALTAARGAGEVSA